MSNNLRFAAVVLLTSVLSACNCGGTSKPDSGMGGGVGGFGGAGGGGAGGGDAGNPGQSGLTLEQFCATAAEGFRNQTKRETSACGVPLLDTDFVHIQYMSQGFPVNFPEAWLGSDCSDKDGGLAQQMNRYITSVNAGRLEYDPAKALACQRAGRTADGGFSPTDFNGKLTGACKDVWKGKVATGGACDWAFECQSGLGCKPTGLDSCVGTCQPLKGAGEACSDLEPCAPEFNCADDGDAGPTICRGLLGPGEVCDPEGMATPACSTGLICFGEQGAELCTAPAVMGQPCQRFPDVGSNCAEGTCVVSGGNIDGLCQPTAELGQACGDSFNGLPRCGSCGTCGDAGVCVKVGFPGDDCEADSDCFDTRFYFCDPNALKCAFRARTGEACVRTLDDNGDPVEQGTCLFVDDFCSITTGAAGVCKNLPSLTQACGQTDALSVSCKEGFCNAPDSSTGTCTARPALGEACSGNGGFGESDCADTDTQFCDEGSGTCAARLTAGTACESASQCVDGLFCITPTGGDHDVCTAPAALGEACEFGSDCVSGFCPEVDGGTPVCAPKKVGGSACEAGSECVSGNCDSVTHVCIPDCAPVISNSQGCMNYDLTSLTSYLAFSMLLVTRRWRARKQASSKQ